MGKTISLLEGRLVMLQLLDPLFNQVALHVGAAFHLSKLIE
jgi:hypothetical protein